MSKSYLDAALIHRRGRKSGTGNAVSKIAGRCSSESETPGRGALDYRSADHMHEHVKGIGALGVCGCLTAEAQAHGEDRV